MSACGVPSLREVEKSYFSYRPSCTTVYCGWDLGRRLRRGAREHVLAGLGQIGYKGIAWVGGSFPSETDRFPSDTYSTRIVAYRSMYRVLPHVSCLAIHSRYVSPRDTPQDTFACVVNAYMYVSSEYTAVHRDTPR